MVVPRCHRFDALGACSDDAEYRRVLPGPRRHVGASRHHPAVAAGVTAFFGDMADAEAQAAAMKEARADAYGQLRAIGSDIGI